jgi:opacity protein-like surface antigen
MRLSNRLRAEVEAGKLSQDYDDPRFSTVSKPDFGARLDWLAAPRTKVSARLSRSLEESTLFGASSYLYTALSADMNHRLTSRLKLSADMSIGREDYQDVSREDDIYGGQLSLRYSLDPRFYIAAGYRVSSRDSNLTEAVSNPANLQDTADYGRSQVFLSLGTLLYPVHKTGFAEDVDRLSLPWADVGWPGFYAGTQLGYDAFHVRTDRERGGSANRAEFGNRDFEAGLFAGYGIDLNRWYLGVELEGSKNRADIEYRKKEPDNRTLEAEHDHSYGMSARLGYTIPNGVLLYGRAGAVRSKMKFSYRVNNLPQNAVDDSTNQTGLRYGLGADIPASDRLFVRLDYSYTDFDSYKADVVTEAEKLDPDQNLFRLGLGWRFGGSMNEETEPATVERSGFYAGTHAGHGSLNSDLNGTQFDGSGAGASGPSDVDGDFGAQTGVTGGVFAGYDLTWGRWYAGLEAELEMSNAKWKQRSASGGRNFSVEKKDTNGLSVRGGYILDNGTLLYVRAGGVDTRFNTDWDRGGNSDNHVDRDDTKSGTRLGLGAEIPLNKRSFARLDYTYTNYESYDFVTSHGAPDDMDFANTETLFRLGLGARF